MIHCFQRRWFLAVLTSALTVATTTIPFQSHLRAAEPAVAPENHLSVQQLADTHTRLGLALFRQMTQTHRQENLSISPTSLSLALALLYGGARSHSQQELAALLGIEGLSPAAVDTAYAEFGAALEDVPPSLELTLANSLWGNETLVFNPEFLDSRRRAYDASFERVDFADTLTALATMNAWVAQQTQGKIPTIVTDSDINTDTVAVILNAVYFSGRWTYPFSEENTRLYAFKQTDGSESWVPMMFQQLPVARSYQNELFSAIELPYGDEERVSMYVFLPHPEVSLAEVHRQLNLENWKTWLTRFEWNPAGARVGLPRFRLETEIEYRSLLEEMGATGLFNADADFSALASQAFWLGSIRQKTYIEVNEAGTEAAAVTVVDGTRAAPAELICDRPFLFAIRENHTGAILFFGSVVDPQV